MNLTEYSFTQPVTLSDRIELRYPIYKKENKKYQFELLESLDMRTVREKQRMVNAQRATESDWLSTDIVRGLNRKEGIITTSGEYKQTKFGEKLEIRIEVDGKSKLYKPNIPSCVNISDLHGMDTENWVGKMICLSITQHNGKDIIIATPKVVAPDKVEGQ